MLVRGRLRKTIDAYIPEDLYGARGMNRAAGHPQADHQHRRGRRDAVAAGRPAGHRCPDLSQGAPRLNTLNRLMARVHTRDFGAAPGSDEAFADWTTVEVASTVVRPAEASVVL